jgi:membrane-associated phospholipid phosphatase
MMKSLKPADTLTIFFSLVLMAITLFFFNRLESAGYLLALYAFIILVQMLLVRVSGRNSFLTVTRDVVFPVLSVLVIFDSMGLIVHGINPQDIDYLLIRLDYLIFGCYPTVYLERFSSPLLTDLLQLAYCTYYFMPIGVGVLLKVQGKHEAFDKYVFLILLCFYFSFVGYMLFPALGPRYTIEHLQTEELGGFMVSKTIQDILNLLEGVKRDAFPSGHTGISLASLFLAFRYAPRAGFILLLPVILLVCATVFCRYHYVVDVIGGVVLCVVTLVLGELYYRRWRGNTNGPSF